MFGLIGCSPNVISTSNSPVPSLTSTKPVVVELPSLTIQTNSSLQNCISVPEQSYRNLPIKGKIVLSGAPYYSGAPLFTPSYMIDLLSGDKIILPQDNNKVIVDSSFSVSPNREWLEYVQANTDEPLNRTLHIVTSNGREHSVIPTQINQRGSLWIDDNQLLVESLREDVSSFPRKARATLWLINPFTGDKKEMYNDYPSQWNADNLFWEFNLSRVTYNPTLNRVIYPTFLEPDRVIRLVDVQTSEILADVPTTDYGKFLAWSPDGKRIAFATQTNKQAHWDAYRDEVFTLTEDGELAQLTHLSETNNYSYITGLAWSADSHDIAFWVNNTDWEKGHTGAHLVTLDTYTSEILEYCDIGNSEGLVYIPWGSPMWSPDGKYLLVNLENPNDESHILAVLVEVTTGKTFQVAENYRAVGWLK
jgi:dipeptidyl aminopeptidase/acylaminoacyl peptidase